uniref:AAA-ATPase Vps4-associated protein 1 n=1 Tax=Myoviridae sp. ct4tH12 TaxID=2825031 RepID=A0A8S5PYH1_9CAUD|nr:MAG TPA: AAA-ATPase Vps4-associated protein 1 [Myoviridae sp. ct4tH12]
MTQTNNHCNKNRHAEAGRNPRKACTICYKKEEY